MHTLYLVLIFSLKITMYRLSTGFALANHKFKIYLNAYFIIYVYMCEGWGGGVSVRVCVE